MIVRAMYYLFFKLYEGLMLIIDENTWWSKLYNIMHIINFETFYKFGNVVDCNKFGMRDGVGA
jgi:hypothetical protein